MRLDKLVIKQLPGIDERFELENLDTVNIIHGPNGSGKSSLTKAISQLLWKNIATGSPFAVEAVFLDGADRWRVNRDSHDVPHWTLNGESKNPLPLPMGHIADCYKMGVLDLVLPAGGEVETKLANSINIEMYGGIDLEKVKKDLFASRPKLANDPRNKLDEAISTHSDLLVEQTQLEFSQQRLPALRIELERKNKAKKKLTLLQNYQNRELYRAQLQEAQSQQAQFSSGQKNTHPNDAIDLKNWLLAEQENRDQIGVLNNEIQTRQNEIDALNFPSGAIEKADPIFLDARMARAKELQDLVDSLEKDLRHQVVVLDGLVKELAPGFASESNDNVPSAEIYQEMSSQYSFLTSHLAQIEGWQKVQTKLDLPDSDELPNNQALLKAMHEWLNGRTAKQGVSHLILVGLGLAILPVGYWMPYAFVLSAPLLGAGIFQWWNISRHHQKQTTEVVNQIRQAGHDFSDQFTASDILELINKIGQDSGIAQTQKELTELLDDKLKSLSLNSDSNDSRINDLRSRFGHSLTDSHIAFLRFLDSMPDFRLARQEVAHLKEELVVQKKELENEFSYVANSLESLGLTKPKDTRKAQHLLTGLNARLSKLSELQSQQNLAQNKHESLKSDQTRTQENLKQLWKRLAIKPQKDAELVQTMVQQINSWDETQKQISQNQTMFDSENQAFCSLPDLLNPDEVEGLSSLELEAMMIELDNDQQTRDDDVREIHDIENKLKSALQSSQIAEAQARCEQARTTLMNTRERELESSLGQLLLDDIGETYQRNFQPEVLAKASEYFSAFTNNLYDLRVRTGTENTGQFYAFENDTEKSFGLAELSDGTRAQLLLAVRLAFITVNEGQARPPLFLDESLTASDPVRFSTIAINISQWAHQQNRQIFYLTSNPGDAQAWIAALKTAEIPSPQLIDLAQVRGTSSGLAADIQVVLPEPVEAPGNRSAQEYARYLKVPRLDGWKNPNEVHLWHLLSDDLPLLHRLVEASTPTYGRWNANKVAMKTLMGMSDEKMKLLEARGCCLKAFFRNWSIGRGKLLTADALADSGAISKSYLAKCRALLTEVESDSQKFMAALRDKKVPGFRKDNIRILEEFFLQEGFIDTRKILSMDDLINTVSVSITPEINNGHLSVSDVRELVLTWYQSLLPQEH